MREVNYDERWKVARDLACKINLWPTVENLRHLDAALRRAKAEGMRDAAKLVDDDCYIPGGQLLPDYEHRCKHNVNQKELAAKIRARAAQIEEGE